MNVAILPICPTLWHSVSMMGLGKPVWIYPPYPHPIPIPIPDSFCYISNTLCS